MCVIMILKPNQTFPKDKFVNAVNNNEHGFGMLVRNSKKGGGNRFDEYSIYEEGQPVSPEEAYSLVDKHKSKFRVVHLRNNSAGEVNKGNVQPIKFYTDSEGNNHWFLHNGTAHKYALTRRTTYYSGVRTDASDHPEEEYAKSDSLRFCETFLFPLFNDGMSLNQKAFVNLVLKKEWGQTWGRAIIVRDTSKNDEPSVVDIGDPTWTEVDGVSVSNDSYFNNTIRGTVFEEKKKLEEEERRKKSVVVSRGQENFFPNGEESYPDTTSFQELNRKARTHAVDLNIMCKYVQSCNPQEMWSADGDFIAEGLWEKVGSITTKEWQKFFEVDPQSAAIFITHIVADAVDMEVEIDLLEDSLEQYESDEEKKNESV